MSFIQTPLTIEQMIGITTQPPTLAELLIQIYRQFYEGDQKVKLSSRQELYIIDRNDLPNSFSNMVQLVVNKIKNRLKVERNGEGVRASDDNSTDFADFATTQWKLGNIDAQQSELMTYVLRDGVAALFTEWPEGSEFAAVDAKQVWSGAADYGGNEGVRFHSLDRRNDLVDFASYRWLVPVYDEDGTQSSDEYIRLNIYVTGRPGITDAAGADGMARIYRYYSNNGGDEFLPLTTEPTTIDGVEVPSMVELETGLPLSNPEILDTPFIPITKYENTNADSEIRTLIRLQSLRDKSMADVDMASDLHGLPLITADSLDVETDKEGNTKPFELKPGYGYVAPGAKRVEGADLKLMWDGTLKPYLMEMGMLKNFPVWILNPQDNAVPSGTALKVQERDFVQMIMDKQDKLTVAWQMTFALMREYANNRAGASYPDDSRLKFVWINPATESVIEDNEIKVRTAKDAGLSDETIWEEVYGFTDSEIEEERERLQKDLDYRKQQAEIVQILTTATLNPDGALDFAGLSDEEQSNLVLFGNAEIIEETTETDVTSTS